MNIRDQFVLMASYNEWMNAKLYQAAGGLSAEELLADRKAFFKSIMGTLNHLAVADTIWLKRFATHPANHAVLEPIRRGHTPTALDQLLFTDIAQLSAYRKMLDQLIIEWVMILSDADLEHVLHYANTKGIVGSRRLASLLMHFFNHQTHHRGQATTLLSQAGIDVGVTDLLALIPNEAELIET